MPIALLAGASTAAGIVFSNTGHSKATPFEDRPAEVFKLKDVPFKGAVARQASRTIRRFVSSAVLRRNLDEAWTLASPSLRSGLTRKQWNSGRLPVVPFPANALQDVGWRLDYAYANDVVLDVLLTSKPGSNVDSEVFLIELKRFGRAGAKRWLVEAWLPRKAFDDARETAAPTPKGKERRSAPRSGVPPQTESAISKAWFAVPLAIVGLVLLIPLAFLFSSWRARRAYREG